MAFLSHLATVCLQKHVTLFVIIQQNEEEEHFGSILKIWFLVLFTTLPQCCFVLGANKLHRHRSDESYSLTFSLLRVSSVKVLGVEVNDGEEAAGNKLKC